MHRANLKLEYDCLDILSSLVKRLFLIVVISKQFQNNSIIYHAFFKIISYDEIEWM